MDSAAGRGRAVRAQARRRDARPGDGALRGGVDDSAEEPAWANRCRWGTAALRRTLRPSLCAGPEQGGAAGSGPQK